MRKRPLIREDVAPEIPLRLGTAVALAFSDGSMAAGLRREAARSRLVRRPG